jgi:hypothetical protein
MMKLATESLFLPQMGLLGPKVSTASEVTAIKIIDLVHCM